ncbi:MAG TPA: cysteine desulfurase [Syntrophales bacterium]|nr:cysteine desulfurase [Syntrophales bacterium]
MDVSKIRSDFPFLNQTVGGKRIIYFDNAATTQKPVQILNTISKYYEKYNAAVSRSTHEISNTATAMYRQAHDNVAKFIGAGSYQEIVFVRNSTEAINLVCYSLAFCTDKTIGLSPGDEIIIPLLEHHSDLVPWQRLKELFGITINVVGINNRRTVDPDDIRKHITAKTRLVCCAHVSNVLGTINPVKEIARIAHEDGALFLVDGTQSAPHMPVNVQNIDCDFFAFSGHKMLAPLGIGVLYGKKELLGKMPPFLSGGGMIADVTLDCATWNELPWKFEAGTPEVCGGIALGGAIDPNTGDVLEGAIDYLGKIGMENVFNHETELVGHALERLRAIDGIIVYAPAESVSRCGIISFNVIKDGEVVSPNIIANFLNDDGIAVRAGGLCAFPLTRGLNAGGVVRVSFYIYNTIHEIDIFIDSVTSIISKKII